VPIIAKQLKTDLLNTAQNWRGRTSSMVLRRESVTRLL